MPTDIDAAMDLTACYISLFITLPLNIFKMFPICGLVTGAQSTVAVISFDVNILTMGSNILTFGNHQHWKMFPNVGL